MKQEQKSGKRKKLLVLLLFLVVAGISLVLAFLNLRPKNVETASKVGINNKLPNSSLDKQNSPDKLSIYLQADRDSVKRAEQMSRDPYYQQLERENRKDSDVVLSPFNPFNVNSQIKSPLFQRRSSADENALKVKQKIAELEEKLTTNVDPVKSKDRVPGKQVATSMEPAIRKDATVSQPIPMPTPVSQSIKPVEDPEIAQLNAMMDKVLDIQHPQRVEEKMQAASSQEKSRAIEVQNKQEEDVVDYLTPAKEEGTNKKAINQFYESGEVESAVEDNAISASIAQTETIIPGATITLRLNQDMYISGNLIPKGTAIFGSSALQGDRLKITINSISYHNSIYPVELSVYSLDGMEGILMRGSITRDVAKESAAQTAGGIQMSTLDPSFTAQATAAGVQAVKTLITRKAKLIQVTVKEGPVLLRNTRK